MAKRKSETSEDDSRAARHARRRKNAELQESATADVKSEAESSSESEADEQTEFDLETLEDKVTRMNQNLVHLKDGKEKISKLTVQVADEEKKVTAKEKILKTLLDEKPILIERKMLVDNYPEDMKEIMNSLNRNGNPYDEAIKRNLDSTRDCYRSLGSSKAKLSVYTQKLNYEQSTYLAKGKDLDSLTANIVLGKTVVHTVEKTVIKEVEKKKKCGVCLEEYNSSTVKEAILKVCGHKFCLQCMTKICNESDRRLQQDRRLNYRPIIHPPKCPICQKHFYKNDILKIFD